jgi:hypothetical protein
MPPRCAKCAMPLLPREPSSSSSAPNTITKVRAFIGMGGNSGMMMRFGEQHAEGQQQREQAPEAPTVGTLEPVSAGDQQLRHRGGQHAGEQELQVARAAPQPLQLRAEHPQAQHVEEQVEEAPCRKP